ncbi:uncharacterized protein [Nicotiana sylvestris]|uniref:uncharacterized protein n=1 Tax=Nicotiana sylvestris TaxID=4096 RepID=UPI00388CE340
MNKVCSDWRFCCNYKEHPNGRIWLSWKQNVEVQILLLDEQFIHCEVQERSSTFKTLITVVYARATIKESWLLSGDFNNVLHTDDRIGAPVTQSEIKGFQDAIITLQLTQLKSLGWFYTWCNKQQLEKRVYNRIDWALENVEWMQKYSHIEADFLNPEVVTLQNSETQFSKGNRVVLPNVVYQISDPTVRETWGVDNSSVMDYADFAGIVEKELNTYMASYRLQLNKTRQKLEAIQSELKHKHMDQRLIDQEKMAMMELKLRTNKNTINSIYTDLGDKVSEPILVEEEFVKFFMKLLVENNTTCDDIYEDVKDFFVTGRLHKRVSSTAVTLIPKVQNPSQVKDYRPIACCTTMYKIITKVLTARLKPVIRGLIGRSQSAFIEGRSIIDNILFTHELFKGYNRKGISPRCVLKVDLRKAYDTVE